MDLSYRENYWNSPALKAEFIRFLVRIHGLDLSRWGELGFWDNKYRPFSYFDGNSLVANVCLYSMDMTVRGKRRLGAQISAVGTLPEYRRRGLSTQLTERAMDWARPDHDFFFLFADDDAFPLYKKCGFRPVEEYKPCLSVTGRNARSGAEKMDLQKKEHLEQIYRCASVREPVSDELGVLNRKLFMFWCIYALRDYIHYIAELDLLVLYKRDNGRLTIFDIVGRNIPAFSEVYRYISRESDETVEFLFMVDKLGLERFDPIRVEGNGTHLLGRFPLENSKFIFPYTAHA